MLCTLNLTYETDRSIHIVFCSRAQKIRYRVFVIVCVCVHIAAMIVVNIMKSSIHEYTPNTRTHGNMWIEMIIMCGERAIVQRVLRACVMCTYATATTKASL